MNRRHALLSIIRGALVLGPAEGVLQNDRGESGPLSPRKQILACCPPVVEP